MKIFQYVLLIFIGILGFFTQLYGKDDPTEWLYYGKNNHNTSYAESEKKISPQTAARLKVRWIYITTPDGGARFSGCHSFC